MAPRVTSGDVTLSLAFSRLTALTRRVGRISRARFLPGDRFKRVPPIAD